MEARVTMRQVAAEAGVSVATVSRVMSGYPHVRAEAKAAVEAALRKLGYRPDPALRAIASCRWQGRRSRAGQVIAWLDFSEKASVAPPHKVAEAAASEGYGVEHFAAGRYASARQLGDVLHSRGIGGLVLPNTEETPELSGMPWGRFCAMACGIGYTHNPVDTVRFNPFETVQAAVGKLVAAGARRLGLVVLHGAKGLSGINDKMVAAFDFAVSARRGLGRTTPLITPVGPANAQETRRWWRKERPDGVIGHHGGVAFWLMDSGVRFPRDGFYLSLIREDGDYMTAGFRSLRERCAVVALEQVVLRLRLNQRGVPAFPMEYVISPQWVPGESCPEPVGG